MKLTHYPSWRWKRDVRQNYVLLHLLIVQHLSKAELLALLREAKASRERDWLMILVGFWHGLRHPKSPDLSEMLCEMAI